MNKGRLEAFSDGVIAIIITIMVLEIEKPHDLSIAGLMEVAPHIAVYALSFIYVGIYWNNHHHMFHAVKGGVSGPILWANLHLLFWLSLVPFATAWLGVNFRSTIPIALYGGVLLMCSIAYLILTRLLVWREGRQSTLALALGKDRKMILSTTAYVAALVAAFFYPLVALGLYAGVALVWLVPDPRIERALKTS